MRLLIALHESAKNFQVSYGSAVHIGLHVRFSKRGLGLQLVGLDPLQLNFTSIKTYLQLN